MSNNDDPFAASSDPASSDSASPGSSGPDSSSPFAASPEPPSGNPFDAPAVDPFSSQGDPPTPPKAGGPFDLDRGPVPPLDERRVASVDVGPSATKSGSAKPRCATHPERFARSAACARCGNYACEACFSIDNDLYCTTCADRVGRVVPWENSSEGGVFRRLLSTCKHLAEAPFERFGHIGDGDLGRALSFTASITLASYGVPFLFCGPFVLLGFGLMAANWQGDDQGGLGLAVLIPMLFVGALIAPFLAAASSMLSALIWGSVYHGAAKLAGGQASYSSSLRVAQYQSILVPADVLVSFVSNVPMIGPLISLGWLAAKNVLSIFAYAGHATTQHRLQGSTAWLVAAVPTILAVLLVVALVVAVLVLIFAVLGDDALLRGMD